MMTDKELSEDELFLDKAEALEEEPAEPEQLEEPEPQEPEPEKVEAKQEGPETPTEEPEEPEQPVEDAATVPSWRLREVNEAKAAAEAEANRLREKQAQAEAELRQLQQQMAQIEASRQQKPTPDFYEDPQGYQEHLVSQSQQVNRQLMAQIAETRAIAMYGANKVNEAWNEALSMEATNPSIAQRIMAANNPWAEAVEWKKERDLQAQIGEGGIDGFRKSIMDELAKDPEFRKKVFEDMRGEVGGVARKATPETIPSLNGAPAARMPNGDMEPEPSEDELFLSS